MQLVSQCSIPKTHAQHTSNKKIKTALHQISDSLFWQQRLNEALVSTVDPTEQNNLFNMLDVHLQRCLLANLSMNASSFIIKFNPNVPWVSSDIWNVYLSIYWKQFLKRVRQENVRRKRMNKERINIYDLYLPPTLCKLQKQDWAKNKIRSTHEGIILLLSEYMYSFTQNESDNAQILCTSKDRYEWIDLVVKALSVEKYQSKLTETQKIQARNHATYLNTDYDDMDLKSRLLVQAKDALTRGNIVVRSRTFTTINISRRSAADCVLKAKDFVTGWFRFGSDVKSKTYVSGKIKSIFQIENLHLLMPFLPCYLFPYNVFILIDLWKPCDVNDWDNDTWDNDPETNTEASAKSELGMYCILFEFIFES